MRSKNIDYNSALILSLVHPVGCLCSVFSNRYFLFPTPEKTGVTKSREARIESNCYEIVIHNILYFSVNGKFGVMVWEPSRNYQNFHFSFGGAGIKALI